MKITVDLNTFLMGDLIDLEEAGGSLANLQSAKSIVALVWITRRREDPTFTFEDAKQVPVAGLDIAIAEAEEDADPKGSVPRPNVAAA